MRVRFPAIAPVLAGDLVAVDVGDADPRARAEAQDFVAGRLARAGAVTRAGLAAGGVALDVYTRLRTGRRYAALPEGERHAWAARVCSTGLPLVGEYVRAIRSLTLLHSYETRAGR